MGLATGLQLPSVYSEYNLYSQYMDKGAMSNLLITGSTGFLGSYIMEKLTPSVMSELGIDHVRLVVRSPAKAERFTDVEVVRGDLTDHESLRAAAAGMDVVLHIAALYNDYSKLKEFREANVEGTRALISGMREGSVLILTSTYGVYGFETRPGEDVTEDYEPKRPFWHYQTTKKEQEDLAKEMCEQRGITFIALRPPTFFGKGDYFFVPSFISNLRRGLVMYLRRGGNNIIPWAHVEDVADAHILALRKRDDVKSPAIYNVKSFDATFREMCDAFTGELGMRRVKMRMPYFMAYSSAFLMELLPFRTPLNRFSTKFIASHTELNTSRIEEELGFVPKWGLEELVRESVQWYLAERPKSR